MTTSKGKKVMAYFEIPFAIFAEVDGYYEEGRRDLLCLAAVFNETFYKTRHDNIDYEKEVYHTFIENPVDRDRW